MNQFLKILAQTDITMPNPTLTTSTNILAAVLFRAETNSPNTTPLSIKQKIC